MAAFKIVEGEYAIVSSGGVHKQVPVGMRNGLLYAAASGGYVQLYHNGSTSKDKMRLVELSWAGTLGRTATGRLADMVERPDAQTLSKGFADTLLLGKD